MPEWTCLEIARNMMGVIDLPAGLEARLSIAAALAAKRRAVLESPEVIAVMVEQWVREQAEKED